MFKTSQTHPLRFYAVSADRGQIGMIFCPGKHQLGAISGHWHRDLATDLDAIEAWGATVVVSLVEHFEFDLLKVPDLGERVRERGLIWLHLPIVDMDVPDELFELQWLIAGPFLRERLQAGERVILHCMGGLGRTGMIAARLLCELGESPATAIDRVRAARPGTIQTPAQERHVHDFAACVDPALDPSALQAVSEVY